MTGPDLDPLALFGMYMKVTGVPSLSPPAGADPELAGKRLGIVNGSSWITLWSNWFGRRLLPGVELVNVGNEAVQLSFMRAHHEGRPCPPRENIDLFAAYARQLVELHGVDAVLVSCSTMNRSIEAVREALGEFDVPAISIDEAMMARAVRAGGRIGVVATHGPTVASTQALLTETAQRLGCEVDFAGATVEEAFEQLGAGDIEAHNETVAEAVRGLVRDDGASVVVLAQLSMSVFKLSYPDCPPVFGAEVLTSGETGFARAGEVLRSRPGPR